MTDRCTQPCPYGERVTKLEAQTSHVMLALTKLDEKLDKVLMQLGRVEVLEHKHLSHSEALGRAFERIEAIEKQTSETSRALGDIVSQIKGMSRVAVVVWTIMGGVFTAIALKVFSA